MVLLLPPPPEEVAGGVDEVVEVVGVEGVAGGFVVAGGVVGVAGAGVEGVVLPPLTQEGTYPKLACHH